MKASETSVPTGLARMNGLLAWWGIPTIVDGGEMQARVRQCQTLVADLNTLFNEASCNQTQALSAANAHFVRTIQELLSARQPPELMAAQTSLVTGLMECLAAQTRACAELTQKVHDCCSAMVREAGTEAGAHAARPAPVISQGEVARPAGKEAGKRAAQV